MALLYMESSSLKIKIFLIFSLKSEKMVKSHHEIEKEASVCYDKTVIRKRKTGTQKEVTEICVIVSAQRLYAPYSASE